MTRMATALAGAETYVDGLGYTYSCASPSGGLECLARLEPTLRGWLPPLETRRREASRGTKTARCPDKPSPRGLPPLVLSSLDVGPLAWTLAGRPRGHKRCF